MCGRYEFSLEQPTLREIWQQVQARFPHAGMEAGEIFPTSLVPVLLDAGGTLDPQPARWGFPGGDGKGTVINARAETAASKPMFRSSLLHRRCAVADKRLFRVVARPRKQQIPLPADRQRRAVPRRAVAGLQRRAALCHPDAPANASIADLHDRMPVILREDQLDAWVHDDRRTAYLLTQEAPQLTRKSEDYEQQSLF